MEDHPGQREVTTPELLSWINPDKLGDKITEKDKEVWLKI